MSACKLKGCWFDSQSGHMPGLWARSLVGVERQPIDVSLAHWCFSASLSPSPPFSLKLINKIFFKKVPGTNHVSNLFRLAPLCILADGCIQGDCISKVPFANVAGEDNLLWRKYSPDFSLVFYLVVISSKGMKHSHLW